MASAPSDPSSVQSFAGYRVLRRIAIGGMAEIYEARRREGDTEEPLVLKVLLPQHRKDAELIRGLEHEAALHGALTHPGLIRVYGLEWAEEQPCIVMEMVQGQPLNVILAGASTSGERIPEAVAIFIVDSLLETLAYVHEAKGEDGTSLGIIHRDVTPHNIMVSEDGGIRLGDFGIARSNLRDTRTRTGVIKGKFRYMAPEQVTGSTVDVRTDVYAVGLIFWELLTGSPYITGEREVDVLRNAESPTFRAPSKASEVNTAYDRVLRRALARFPEERYRSVAAFRKALMGAVAPQTIQDAQASLSAIVARHTSGLPPTDTVSLSPTVTAAAPSGTRVVDSPSRPDPMGATLASPRDRSATGSSNPSIGSPSSKTTPLLIALVVVLFGAWVGPAFFDSTGERPQAPPLLATPAGAPTTPEEPSPVALADATVGEGTTPADAALDEVEDATSVTRRTPPAEPRVVTPNRTPPPLTGDPTTADGAAPTTPAPPDAATPQDETALRELRRRVAALRSDLARRGIRTSDLSASERESLRSVERAINAGQFGDAEGSLPGVEASLRSVRVDAAFVERKLSRVGTALTAAEARGFETTETRPLQRRALQDFTGGRYEESNRALNQILSALSRQGSP